MRDPVYPFALKKSGMIFLKSDDGQPVVQFAGRKAIRRVVCFHTGGGDENCPARKPHNTQFPQ